MERTYVSNHKKSLYLFLLVFVVYSLIYMTKNCYSAAMASIVDAGVMTKSETGLISAAFYLFYAPFQVVGGIAADKYSPAKLILIGMLGAGTCNLLVYFVEGYVAMIVIWSLNAVFQFGIWPSVFKIVASQLAPEHRMRGVFLINFTTSAGLLVSYVIAIFTAEWKLNFLISAITLFALCIIFLAAYAYIKRDMVKETEAAPAAREPVHKISGRELISMILKAGIPFALFVGMIQSMLNLGVKALAPTMMMESYESVTPSLGNALNIILVLVGPVGLCISRLSVFRKMNEPFAISMFFAAMLIPLFTVIFIGKLSVAVITVALTALMLMTSANSIFFSFISKRFEAFGSAATLSGLFNCMSSLGVVLANFVFARIADSFGWQVTAICWFAIVAASFIIAAIMIPFWKRFENNYLKKRA